MTHKKPYYLLDFLKVLTLLAIQTLHAWEFIFYQDDFTLQDKSIIYETMTYFARSFSIGGQILVAIIYFLFGFSGKSKLSLLKISGFALLGQVALTLAFLDKQNFFESIEWDIYAFIAFCNFMLILIPTKWIRSPWFLVFNLMILFVPTVVWHELFSSRGVLTDILVGRIGERGSAAWAPLPWLFHSLAFFTIGHLIKKHLSVVEVWHSFETYIWPAILLACLPHFGAYFHTPIGPHYYEFNFNQPPLVYWSNFLPFVFWMRLSILSSIQYRLEAIPFMKWVSTLMWSRKMGVTYLVAVIYLGIAADFSEVLGEVPYAFDLVYFLVMPVSEILVRLIYKLRKVDLASL